MGPSHGLSQSRFLFARTPCPRDRHRAPERNQRLGRSKGDEKRSIDGHSTDRPFAEASPSSPNDSPDSRHNWNRRRLNTWETTEENYWLDAPLWRASFLGRRASDGTRGTRSSMRTNLCSLNVRTFEFIRDAVSTSVPWHLASIAFNIRSAKGSSIRSGQWQVTKDYLHRTGSRAPKKVNWGFGQLRTIWCETYSSCAYRCHMPAALVVS